MNCMFVFYVLVAVLAGASQARAQLSASASSAYVSKYVWRGFLVDDDPAVQSDFSFGLKGFTAGIWSSLPAADDDGVFINEVDYYLDYTFGISLLSVSAGHTRYDFPAAGGNVHSQEYYLGVSLDTVLSPSLVFYKDYGDEADGGGDGLYVQVGISETLSLSDSLSVDISGTYGYNDKLFISGTGSDIGVGIGLSMSINEKLTLAPAINYSMPMGDLKDVSDGNQESELSAGITVSLGI